MTSYNSKRSLIVVSEFIKGTTYLFPSAESFTLFRELKLSKGKSREDRNSFIVYDDNCNISRVSGASVDSLFLETAADSVVDRRPHIIPVDYKIKGTGLPLFKISVPYMSAFRRRTPFMVFRKYKEIPEKPCTVMGAEIDEHFETFDFCNVYTKVFQLYKRFLFQFCPANGPSFTIHAFQNNFRPFTDFTYKETRFRIWGTLLRLVYSLVYSHELKLFALDDSQPSLADDLVEKPHKSGFFSRRRDSFDGIFSDHPKARDSKNVGLGSISTSNGVEGVQKSSEQFVNPVPREDNPIVLDSASYTPVSGQSFIPNESPPFARFVDSFMYQDIGLIFPKKYTEVGKLETYQDPDDYNADLLTTYAINLDSLVLSTILLALREANIRMAKRQNTLVPRGMSVLPLQCSFAFLGSAVI